MPRRDPFTMMCRRLAVLRRNRADLHAHSTFSDGTYTPRQLVELAGRCGLAALAVTDHDTCAGIAPARQAAGDALEIVSGVELTCEFHGGELHLLGYFFDPDDGALGRALQELAEHRRGRFAEMLRRLRQRGVSMPDAEQAASQAGTLGRRHLAQILVASRKVASIRQAFDRYLGDHGGIQVPKARLAVADAIALVRGAGGVAAWAHPPYDCTRSDLAELHGLGMQAVEIDYPACKPGRQRRLRHWAAALGLAVTGGSDCHGPDAPRNSLGMHGISVDELELLRDKAPGWRGDKEAQVGPRESAGVETDCGLSSRSGPWTCKNAASSSPGGLGFSAATSSNVSARSAATTSSSSAVPTTT